MTPDVKVVPREPTREMLRARIPTADDPMFSEIVPPILRAAVWRAMYDAAPASDLAQQLVSAQRRAEALQDALREIQAMTDEDAGTFRKRGGTYRGLVGVIVDAALAAERTQGDTP